MQQETIEERVVKLLRTYLTDQKEEIAPTANLTEDLHADSLRLLEFILAIEEEFHVHIPEQEVQRLSTVGDVISYLQQRTERK